MIDKLLMKNENYKKKVEELELKSKEIEKLNMELMSRKEIILSFQEKIEKLEEEINWRDKYRFFIFMLMVINKLETKIPKNSKKERNEILWHDIDKIYISREKLKEYLNNLPVFITENEILEFLRLFNILDSEGDRFTKKVSINGKYKRMIILNRNVMRDYLNKVFD